MDRDPVLPWAPTPELLTQLSSYLANRRWYAGDAAPTSLSVLDSGCLAELDGSARLLWAIVEADGTPYQLLIAERPTVDAAGHLQGHENALVGTVGDKIYYGASIDSEMAVALLRTASGGMEDAEWARPLNAEQSNTSLVYDDRLILKLFRRLSAGQTPTSR